VLKLYAPTIAGVAYFALGGLWFTPLFGFAWDRALMFSRPRRWRPPVRYYIVPLLGCLAVSFAMSLLADWFQIQTLERYLALAAVLGLGVAAPITAVNAVSPNTPRPGLYAAVVGSYHAVGIALAATVLYLLTVK
jgi:hypothetical protein